MKISSLRLVLAIIIPLLLGGCAASQLSGFENAYQGYKVPESLVSQIRTELRKNGLPNAQVIRDNVGRIRLAGSYRNEEEVDLAFVIVQSIVGLKSTSPLYPENIAVKRWEIEAKRAMERHASNTSKIPVKRALIIGINNFLDGKKLLPIMGEDDARLVKSEAEKAGYRTTALLGPEATKKNIEAALERFKQDLGPNDSLLIYISSHGNPPIPSYQGSDVRKMSIAAYDTGEPNFRGSRTEYDVIVYRTSVSDTKVQELAKMPTRQTRVIIDTCYSGEILKDIPDESARYILKTNGGVPEQASISMAAWTGPAYAAKGIVFAEDSAPTSTTKGKGRRQAVPAARQNSEQADINRYTIITATSDNEVSWGPRQGESFDSPIDPNKKLKGSFFTQAFFEFLNKYDGQLEPAFRAVRDFTAEKVAIQVSKSTNRQEKQNPRMNPPLPAGDRSSLYN